MSKPKIIIFMATYNGGRYLKQQLESIISQSYAFWELWISDDGSVDDTCEIIKAYQGRLKNKIFFTPLGPQNGYASNFLSLVCNENATGDFYAYSDQDDIWEEDKLTKAVNWLNTINPENPALYCSRTKLINSENQIIGESHFFKKKPAFLNALVQNIAGGNTMVFNQAAINLLRIAGKNINIVAHDWWTYLLVTGAGGDVYYDLIPAICYRQHQNNLIGSNLGCKAAIKRLLMLFKGHLKQWNDINFKSLSLVNYLLTKENQQILMSIITARSSRKLSNLLIMKRLGIYRQTFLSNLALITAILFGKI